MKMISDKKVSGAVYIIPFSLLASGFVAQNTLAADILPPTNYTEIKPLVEGILQWLLSISGGIALLVVIYGGIIYITSTGNPEKAEEGKRVVTWTLFGLFVVLTSYAIITVIEDIFVN